MEFLLDTANIDDITHFSAIYPITGITSNPKIIQAEGRMALFPHFKEIRSIIGEGRTLHMQTVAKNAEGMVKEAETILENVDDKVYIKIPVTEEGLKAIRTLKKRGAGVTGTAIYSKIQGFMAIAAGADFIAPYYNRMEMIGIDSREVIASFADVIARTGSSTRILAASFKNITQVNAAIENGAHCATVSPTILHQALGMSEIKKAVDDFADNWRQTFGTEGIVKPVQSSTPGEF